MMARLLLYSVLSLLTLPSFSQTGSLFNVQPGYIVSYNGDTIHYNTSFFSVPENRMSNDTKTISLKVLIVKSSSSSPAFPVVFLAGGPGQSGINYIRQDYFQDVICSLQKHHDVILLDQRGCGSSLPSLIYSVPPTDKKNIFLSPETIIKVANIQAKAGADTMRSRGIDISGYNTVQNASDLVDLSKVLGISKMNLLAISYGTHLALEAARKNPEIIDHMVLIGTSGPDHMHHLPSTYDKQIDRISMLAAQDSGLSVKVPDMRALLKKLLLQLEKRPIKIRIRENKSGDSIDVPVGKFGLQFILRLDAGDASDFVLFPAMLYGIDRGEYSIFQEYVEKRYNQLNGDYASAIGVVRTASGASKPRLARIRKESKTALLGNSMNTPDIYARNYWGLIDLGDKYRMLFKSDVASLFVSGSMDSNTPVSNAEEIIKNFSNAQHVIVDYAGHEDMLSNANVQKVFIDYLNGAKPVVKEINSDRPVFEGIP